MQITKDEYNPEKHEQYEVIGIDKSIANLICLGVLMRFFSPCEIEQGKEIVICNSATNELAFDSMIRCKVQIKDCKKVKELSSEECDAINMTHRMKEKYAELFIVTLENVKRLIEIPCLSISEKDEVCTYYFDKGNIMEYPENVELDEKAYKQMKK